MLRWRLLSAGITLGLILTFLHLDFHHPPRGASGVWMLPLFFAVAILATGELLHLLKQGGMFPATAAVYAGMIGTISASCVPMVWPLSGSAYPADCPLGKLGWPLGASLLGLLLLMVVEMRRTDVSQAIQRVSAGFFVLAYLGLNLSFWVALRLFHDHRWGMAALFSTLLVVKLSDTGAYFVGRLLGRHKLAPVISPGKTVEGAVGGLLAGIGGAFLFFYVLVDFIIDEPQRPQWWATVIYGVVLTLAGMVGDLAESLIKRSVAVKDSSSWVPGLGGIMDMIDSVLVAAPPAYLCWVAGLVGPGSSS